MRIVFAGTPEFAATALRALAAAGHDIALVLTQRDKPAGRGLELRMSEVKKIALANGLPLLQPESLRDEVVVARLRQAKADIMVVAAYGLILPQAVLEVTPLGCINIHASLLPRWRGAAPIQRAILAGDQETGISIMQMDAGLDTGPILLQRSLPIAEDDTAATLHDKLAALGGDAALDVLAALEKGTLKPVPQPMVGVTYAHRVSKHEARLDWTRPALEVERTVRAYNPAPGAHTSLLGDALKVWRGRADQAEQVAGEPGQVIEIGVAGLRVACGRGVLDILELQRPGGRRQAVAEFLRGNAISLGARLGA